MKELWIRTTLRIITVERGRAHVLVPEWDSQWGTTVRLPRKIRSNLEKKDIVTAEVNIFAQAPHARELRPRRLKRVAA